MNTSTTNETSKLYAHVVLDRSGSMQSCADDAVGSYNAYAAKLPEAARVSLTLGKAEVAPARSSLFVSKCTVR